nr:uncharacterized mitochondrial protein AtMg00810-like [Tanacetum cinerariifolium]
MLFTKRFDDEILVVQVYVDDIIFGSTNPRYATLFYDLMKSHFEMSMMGEMTFFLGLQVNQSPSGIFINHSNYLNEILNKYGLNTCDIIGTPMDIKDKLDLDWIGTPVDATKYRSMIGALMYLTLSRPDIIHATCVCARYQAQPTKKHLKEVKRIFRYLWGTVNTGLWYTKDSGFELTRFLDATYAGCKDTFKSTSGGAQFLGEKLVSWSSNKQDCTSLLTAKPDYVSFHRHILQPGSTLQNETYSGLIPFHQGARRKGYDWAVLCQDRLPTGRHVHQSTSSGQIQLFGSSPCDYGNPSKANIKQALVTHWFTHTVFLSTLRRSGLRTAGAAAKPCQGDSSKFYLITGHIYTDQRGTVSKIKILDHKHAEGTAKNSQDYKVLRLDVKIYAMTTLKGRLLDLVLYEVMVISRPKGSGEVVCSSPHLHYDCYYSKINQGEVRVALQKMGRNKAVGPDQIPIEAWRVLADHESSREQGRSDIVKNAEVDVWEVEMVRACQEETANYPGKESQSLVSRRSEEKGNAWSDIRISG